MFSCKCFIHIFVEALLKAGRNLGPETSNPHCVHSNGLQPPNNKMSEDPLFTRYLYNKYWMNV